MNAVDSFSGRICLIGPSSALLRIVLFLIAGTLLLGVGATSVRRNQAVSLDSPQTAIAHSSGQTSDITGILYQKEIGKNQRVDHNGNPSVIRKPGTEPVVRLSTNTVVPDDNFPQPDHLEDLDAYVTDRLANHPTVASINESARQAEADWSTQFDSWKKTCDWQHEKTHKLYLSE